MPKQNKKFTNINKKNPLQKKQEDGERKKPKKERPQVGISDKKLFVMGLPKHYTNEEFEKLMGEAAPVKKVFIITKPGRKECTGNGFAIYGSIQDAHIAKRNTNRKVIKSGKETTTLVVKFADKKLRDGKEETMPIDKKEDSFNKLDKLRKRKGEEKEEKIKMVENENEDQNKERTKMILNDVLHEIDINENVLEQSEDEDELKLTRKEREAKKKMMKGEMKRKQSHDECIESTHIRFDNDDETYTNVGKEKLFDGFIPQRFEKDILAYPFSPHEFPHELRMIIY